MVPQTLRTGWYSNNRNEHLFAWGTARDKVGGKNYVVFAETAGDDACQVVFLEINQFREYLARHQYRPASAPPRTLPVDFPTNLYVNYKV